LTMADIRKALDMLESEVRSERVDGLLFWSVASDDTLPLARGAHLLQTYDELVVGFTESRFFGDPGVERARAAGSGGDGTLPSGGVVLNGRIGGHWRRKIVRNLVRMELYLYEEPKRADARALDAAASDLGRFLGREVELETTLP
ncbi:MAG: winged helix DNA-binding domain-containing protein, partial [Actinomycetota bacterium]|nr:winged helix DNA-binding domain-containing protein [Actinomycetota bacterium]